MPCKKQTVGSNPAHRWAQCVLKLVHSLLVCCIINSFQQVFIMAETNRTQLNLTTHQSHVLNALGHFEAPVT